MPRLLASRLVDRFTPKPVLSFGLLVATVGFVLLTRIDGHGDYASHVPPGMVVLGVGLGMAFVPITIAATSGVASGDSGLASGLLNTTQQVGGSLGLAILSSVSTSRTTSALDGGSALPLALTHGFKGAFVVAAGLCAVARLAGAGAVARPPARARRRAGRGDHDLVHPLPRCTRTAVISLAWSPSGTECAGLYHGPRPGPPLRTTRRISSGRGATV